jgi:hypothetical protein
MKTSTLAACCLAGGLAFAGPSALAQTGAGSPAPSSVTAVPAVAAPAASAVSAAPPSGTRETITDSTPTQGEPAVRHTVIEDRGAKIDELKVRGQTKRITVTPKHGITKPYEILSDDSTGMGDSTARQTPHGNEGRRVWNVLSF